MCGDECNTHVVVAHNHERLVTVATKAVLEIFGVAGEIEVGRLNGFLVDRRRYENVDVAGLQICHGSFEGCESGFTGSFSGHAGINLEVFVYDVDDIVLTVAGVGSRVNAI